MSKFLTRLKNWMTSDGGKAFMKTLAKLLIGAAAGAGGATCFTGCSSFVPDSKTQSMEVYALGLPAIAVIKSSTQTADNRGEHVNTPSQSNPVTVNTPIIKAP